MVRMVAQAAKWFLLISEGSAVQRHNVSLTCIIRQKIGLEQFSALFLH